MNKKAEIISFMIVCMFIDFIGILLYHISILLGMDKPSIHEVIGVGIFMLFIQLGFGICTVNDCGDKRGRT